MLVNRVITKNNYSISRAQKSNENSHYSSFVKTDLNQSAGAIAGRAQVFARNGKNVSFQGITVADLMKLEQEKNLGYTVSDKLIESFNGMEAAVRIKKLGKALAAVNELIKKAPEANDKLGGNLPPEKIEHLQKELRVLKRNIERNFDTKGYTYQGIKDEAPTVRKSKIIDVTLFDPTRYLFTDKNGESFTLEIGKYLKYNDFENLYIGLNKKGTNVESFANKINEILGENVASERKSKIKTGIFSRIVETDPEGIIFSKNQNKDSIKDPVTKAFMDFLEILEHGDSVLRNYKNDFKI